MRFYTRLWSTLFIIPFILSGCKSNTSYKRTKIYRTSPRLLSFNSCEELHTRLKNILLSEVEYQLRHNYSYTGIDDAIDLASNESSPSSSSDGSGESKRDSSGTNNQELGVDESDFVKNDGYYIYLLNNNQLEILGLPTVGDLEHISRTEIEGSPFEMLMTDNKIMIFSSIYQYDYTSGEPFFKLIENQESYRFDQGVTKVTVVDITDRYNIEIKKEIYIEGHIKTARKVNDSVRMINYQQNVYIPDLQRYIDEYGLTDNAREALIQETMDINREIVESTSLEQFIPQLYYRVGDDFEVYQFNSDQCSNFNIADDSTGLGVTSILTMDLSREDFDFEVDHIISNPTTIYASEDTLLIAEDSQAYWWFYENEDLEQTTNIHSFDISSPTTTNYLASGRINGWILNQFSLSVYNDFIRVAATTGRNFRDDMENHIYVLEQNKDELSIVGEVSGIAPNESIWSARFVDDKGFIVTFRQIDPLWTIDLSNPYLPTVEGELEVLGVSTYIHPLGNEHLLTVGISGDDSGLDWNTKISLFNIEDFSLPYLQSEYSLSSNNQSSWSEAVNEHKAFQYWGPKKLLAIPSQNYSSYGYNSYQTTLELIRVDTDEELSYYGSIDHSSYANNCGSSWANRIRRSIFVDDHIYVIGTFAVSVHSIDDLSLIKDVTFSCQQF